MADLRRTPSIQHAVVLLGETVEATVLNMRKLDEAKITISLNPGRRLFKPLMEGWPLEWATKQIALEKNPNNILPNRGLLEAFDPYAKTKKVSWFRECEKYGYPIGSGMIIPVRPAGYWFEGGRPRVLWVQSWKGRTLSPLQKAIFNTILRDTFFIGDFKTAALEWVDLRAPTKGEGRDVEVVDGDELGQVSRDELAHHLHILVSAFETFSAEKKRRKDVEKSEKKGKGKGAPFFEEGYLEEPPHK